jgi:hypothetical protein
VMAAVLAMVSSISASPVSHHATLLHVLNAKLHVQGMVRDCMMVPICNMRRLCIHRVQAIPKDHSTIGANHRPPPLRHSTPAGPVSIPDLTGV